MQLNSFLILCEEQKMKNTELTKAQKAINVIAKQEGMTAEAVLAEMRAAINEGLQSTDPAVQEMWKKLPCKGETPEPEELIAWLAEQVREKLKK